MVEHQDSLCKRSENELGKHFKHLLGGTVVRAKVCLSCTLSCACKLALHVHTISFERACVCSAIIFFFIHRTRYFHGWTGRNQFLKTTFQSATIMPFVRGKETSRIALDANEDVGAAHMFTRRKILIAMVRVLLVTDT